MDTSGFLATHHGGDAGCRVCFAPPFPPHPFVTASGVTPDLRRAGWLAAVVPDTNPIFSTITLILIYD